MSGASSDPAANLLKSSLMTTAWLSPALAAFGVRPACGATVKGASAAMRAGVRGWMVAWYLAGRAAVQGRVAKASLAVREASRVRAASPLLKMLFFVFIILCFKLHIYNIMSGLLSYSTYTFTVRVSGLPTSRTM